MVLDIVSGFFTPEILLGMLAQFLIFSVLDLRILVEHEDTFLGGLKKYLVFLAVYVIAYFLLYFITCFFALILGFNLFN